MCFLISHSRDTRWDEWVPEDRVLPPTEENYAQQQKLRELANPLPAPAPKKKGAAAPEGKKGASAPGAESTSKGVKRSRDQDLEKVALLSLSMILV